MNMSSFLPPALRSPSAPLRSSRLASLLYSGALFCVSVLLLPLFSGCAAPASSETPPTASASAGKGKPVLKPNPFEKLEKNMTAVQVRQLVGEPAKINPFKAGDLQSQVWVYHRIVAETTRQIVTGSRDVPYSDPISGRSGTTKEVVYGPEFVTVSETIELLMIGDRLIQWKRKAQEDRQHD